MSNTPGASKGTPGDAKCVTEILGQSGRGDKNKECNKFDFGWGSAPDPAGELTAFPQTP